MSYRCRIALLAALCCAAICALPAQGRTNVPYLVLYPRKWENAATNYIAFKTRLGFTIYTNTVETVTGGATNDYTLVRSYLTDFRTNTVPTNEEVYVLFFGNFFSIPAPTFRVLPSDGSTFYSDIYYRDLHTDFNSDGDTVFAEFGNLSTSDFDTTTFNAAFPTISNDLFVGRIPIHQSWDAASAEAVLDHIMLFEREVSVRKDHAIMSAGRIDTGLPVPDSWEYVLKDVVNTITNDYPRKEMVTVVHIPTGYTGITGMHYTVEGSDIPNDYTEGQDIIRGLWETNDQCAFLCNVSHGGAYYDFAIRRNGAGFPTNVRSAVIISMSCASYKLGKAALTNGLAATYLGSSAVVTPDVVTLLSLQDMVSAVVQRQAALKIFCQTNVVGKAFQECFDYYVESIQTAGVGAFYGSNKPDILRNVTGFGITGDPTLVHEYDDRDGDGLLDPEEEYLGTVATNADTDADGLPDGFEFEHATVDPLVHNGIDTDDDHVLNADEILAGTDPLNINLYPCVETVEEDVTNEHLRIEWASVTGRTYQVQSSSLLNPSSWTNCSTNWGGTGGTLLFESTNTTGAALFYRLVITR